MMVGMNISDEQLGGIADRAISDADVDKDGVISFEELKRVSKCDELPFVFLRGNIFSIIVQLFRSLHTTLHLYLKIHLMLGDLGL